MAITLLILHLFSIAGYYIALQFLIEHTDRELVQQLDNDQYDDEELIEIKLPLHLPYMISYDYARVDGEVELEGMHYIYVKRKVHNDTLYLLCLPNKGKMKLHQVQTRCIAQIADVSSEDGSNNSVYKYYSTPEFWQPVNSYVLNAPVQPHKQEFFRFAAHLASSFPDISFPPPKKFYS